MLGENKDAGETKQLTVKDFLLKFQWKNFEILILNAETRPKLQMCEVYSSLASFICIMYDQRISRCEHWQKWPKLPDNQCSYRIIYKDLNGLLESWRFIRSTIFRNDRPLSWTVKLVKQKPPDTRSCVSFGKQSELKCAEQTVKLRQKSSECQKKKNKLLQKVVWR